MLSISPAVRLSFGLMVLTLSILLFASALGLTPNTDKNQLQARQALSQTLAFQALVGYSRNDRVLVEQVLDNAVASNADLLSAAVRRAEGDFFYRTERHTSLWPIDVSAESTPRFVSVPLLLGGTKIGVLELAFESLGQSDTSYFGWPRQWLLVIFLIVAAFISYRLFIGRALRYLDPSSVVPARVRNALNVLAEGVFILDRREHIVLVNTILSDRLGVDEKRLLGRKAATLAWLADDAKNVLLPWSQALQSGEKVIGVRLTCAAPDGRACVFRVNAVPIFDNKGNSQGVIASFDDVSELEEKNSQLENMVAELASVQAAIEEKNRSLEHMAAHDPLTGCFNRRAMRAKLDQVFDTACVKRSPLCCIMLDIDHFKRINDTYGHTMGDDIIKMVADILHEQVRASDFVARFGGEEFCIILPDTEVEHAAQIAERCRATIEQSEHKGVRVTSSFGLASLQVAMSGAGELVNRADEALYYSKQHGRNQANCWHSSMTNPGVIDGGT
ncbi:GGDEF domain-containing protein [uncultured Gilvimarinus sp.]|uniref:GGDEF domain-containing protein n=1 Tax=uncultured Gilvimarinus sp. TaxID=1689143 RepID=UPI0030ECDA3B|tara:strand:+ start:516 stop:2024 length:1509 start_codon:yes stop_codon:yes gene_type:complete